MTGSGSPVAAILNGGAQYAQFTAWLDRFYDLGVGLGVPWWTRTRRGQGAHHLPPIPRVQRVTFWWAGSDRRSDLKTVWQQMVDYLKAKAPVLTNVLFAMHMDSGDATMLQNWDLWYPGNSVCRWAGLEPLRQHNRERRNKYLRQVKRCRWNDGPLPIPWRRRPPWQICAYGDGNRIYE